jgi:hypothetical protein
LQYLLYSAGGVSVNFLEVNCSFFATIPDLISVALGSYSLLSDGALQNLTSLMQQQVVLLDRQLTDMQRGNVILYFEATKREDWCGVL